MAEQVDYDYQPETSGGKYLSLKNKGDKINIRIADKPISYFVHWVNNKPQRCDDPEDCKTCLEEKSNPKSFDPQQRRKQVFVWPVIDRKDGIAKIFKGGASIFLGLREYALNTKWGDPTKWDVEITRTEIRPKYYSVIPDPDSRTVELTKEELTGVNKLAPLINEVVAGEQEDVDEEKEDLPF